MSEYPLEDNILKMCIIHTFLNPKTHKNSLRKGCSTKSQIPYTRDNDALVNSRQNFIPRCYIVDKMLGKMGEPF